MNWLHTMSLSRSCVGELKYLHTLTSCPPWRWLFFRISPMPKESFYLFMKRRNPALLPQCWWKWTNISYICLKCKYDERQLFDVMSATRILLSTGLKLGLIVFSVWVARRFPLGVAPPSWSTSPSLACEWRRWTNSLNGMWTRLKKNDCFSTFVQL